MKLILAATAALAFTPSLALAQYGYQNPYAPRPAAEQPRPRSSSSYDWQSGNQYRTRTDQSGTTTVNGNNVQTGAMWNTRIKPNGDQSGTDANGNMWNYNARSGSYMSTDGTTCIGKGATRVCN